MLNDFVKKQVFAITLTNVDCWIKQEVLITFNPTLEISFNKLLNVPSTLLLKPSFSVFLLSLAKQNAKSIKVIFPKP